MVDKRKPGRYIPIDSELSPDHAMVQSATLLDHAAYNAIQSNDFDKLVTAAKCWAELGQIIGIVANGEEEEIEVISETEILGFRSEEEREDYEDRAAKRKGKK